MSKYTIMSIIIVVAVFFWIASCDAADFTTDERTLYHLGAGALIGGGVGLVGIATGTPFKETVWAGLATTAVIAGAKEAGDGYFDYGDFVYTVIASPLGDLSVRYLGAKLGIKADNHGGSFSLTRDF